VKPLGGKQAELKIVSRSEVLIVLFFVWLIRKGRQQKARNVIALLR
jgi:hypothetical protein